MGISSFSNSAALNFGGADGGGAGVGAGAAGAAAGGGAAACPAGGITTGSAAMRSSVKHAINIGRARRAYILVIIRCKAQCHHRAYDSRLLDGMLSHCETVKTDRQSRLKRRQQRMGKLRCGDKGQFHK